MATATRRSARLSTQGSLASDASGLAPVEASTRTRKRKPPEIEPAIVQDACGPSTPVKRRALSAAKTATALQATPTPSAVSLMAAPASNGPITPNAGRRSKGQAQAVARRADPNATNAMLLSPGTSRVVASQKAEPAGPGQAAESKTTMGNILEEACRHLISMDARMGPLIKKHHCRIFSPEGLAENIDPFESLASGVISQQVSGAAARSIKTRFAALFQEEGGSAAPDAGARTRFPAPSVVAACPLDRLRTAGLSQRKAEYIQGLAAKFADGELSAHMLADAPYEEVLERLTAVRGLGRWSVEMFACFGLKQLDVFSLGDLGVQRGMAAFVGRDVAKLKAKGGGKWKYMSEKEMKEISARFAPYRSLFMWYMWRVEETDVSTLED